MYFTPRELQRCKDLLLSSAAPAPAAPTHAPRGAGGTGAGMPALESVMDCMEDMVVAGGVPPEELEQLAQQLGAEGGAEVEEGEGGEAVMNIFDPLTLFMRAVAAATGTTGRVFFTKNGQFLGFAFEDVPLSQVSQVRQAGRQAVIYPSYLFRSVNHASIHLYI